MAEDIAKERMRVSVKCHIQVIDINHHPASSSLSKVGGDWVVAFAVYDRKDRDIFRTILGQDFAHIDVDHNLLLQSGSEVIFVLLDLDKDLLKERLSGRRQGEGRRFFTFFSSLLPLLSCSVVFMVFCCPGSFITTLGH